MVTVVCVTLSTTSSVAVAHGGVALLVTVSRSVAVPAPVNVARGLRLLASAMFTGPLTTDQVAVPFVALPARLNSVVAPAEQVDWSGPAATVGALLTVSTTSSVAVAQGGFAPVSLRVAVPVPVNVAPEVR